MTRRDICIDYSTVYENIGSWEYFGNQTSPPGLIWCHRTSGRYLYPWSSGVRSPISWRIGPSYQSAAAWSICSPALSTESGYYAILDSPCNNFQVWNSSASEWVPDQISITQIQGVCVVHCDEDPNCYVMNMHSSSNSDITEAMTLNTTIDGNNTWVDIYFMN